MRFPLGNVHTGQAGFQKIVDLFLAMESASDVTCEVDMSNLSWIDANMCSPLGAILSRKKKRGARIHLINPQDRLKKLLIKNRFLSQFQGVSDVYETTIEYHQFDCSPQSSSVFQGHVTENFRPGSKGLPTMSDQLLRKFRESLYEIFQNAREHSESTDGVFSCGQHYPAKNRLDFTITDLGIGIDGSIKKKLNVSISADKAIEWAVSGKTTRGRTGGLGLQLLMEFIRQNNGRLIIVSGAAYWQIARREISGCLLQVPFPGTSVTIEVDTADRSSYCLKSEINPASIF